MPGILQELGAAYWIKCKEGISTDTVKREKRPPGLLEMILSPRAWWIASQHVWSASSLHLGASQVSLVVKNPPAMQEMWETWVRSLRWEGPLEEGMTTHSSTLAWRIPWTEEAGGLPSIGSSTIRHDWRHLARMHSLHLRLLLVISRNYGRRGRCGKTDHEPLLTWLSKRKE